MRTRKLTAVLLALSMVCLAACGKKLTPEEVLKKATKKQQAMTNMDADCTMSVSMELAGQSVDYDADLHIKASGLNSEDLKMAMQMDASIMGQDMSANTYYTDGYYYTETMGEKMKMAMDIGEMTETLKQNSAFTEIPADAYKSLEMTTEGNNQIISFVADGSKMTELVNSVMGSMMSGMTGDTDSSDMGIGDVEGTLTVDKDFNVIEETIKGMSMKMTIEGMEMNASVDMDMVINNPGQEVAVDLPDDLDSYEEMTE